VEIFTLRKYLQNKYMQQNKSRLLDDFISSQIPHHERSRLGYNQTKKGSRSKTTEQETRQRSYAEIIRDFFEKKKGKKSQEEYHRDTAPPRIFRIRF